MSRWLLFCCHNMTQTEGVLRPWIIVHTRKQESKMVSLNCGNCLSTLNRCVYIQYDLDIMIAIINTLLSKCILMYFYPFLKIFGLFPWIVCFYPSFRYNPPQRLRSDIHKSLPLLPQTKVWLILGMINDDLCIVVVNEFDHINSSGFIAKNVSSLGVL